MKRRETEREYVMDGARGKRRITKGKKAERQGSCLNKNEVWCVEITLFCVRLGLPVSFCVTLPSPRWFKAHNLFTQVTLLPLLRLLFMRRLQGKQSPSFSMHFLHQHFELASF